jgi:NAD(P)-dependent dehydrogenase (short-subunit alcohol dehydrogenase family)
MNANTGISVDLSGLTAVVTGAGQGVGAGIAERLATAGASVVLTDLDKARAEATAAGFGDRGLAAIGVEHDVTDELSCADLARATIDEFQHVDIIVNNAGINNRTEMLDMPPRQWQTVIDVNLSGVYHTTHALLPLLLERDKGRIVNVSSVVGRSGEPLMTHYSASKFGVVGLTQALAHELAKRNVTVNAVCPGVVRTALWDVELAEISERDGCTVEEAWERTLEEIPLRRPQTPQDIGSLIAFLASDLAENITGQAINIDGGYDMH